ncbi:MAG: hypothetical protein NVS1B2_11570 [Vulcanimicrobiaceae bacterium]
MNLALISTNADLSRPPELAVRLLGEPLVTATSRDRAILLSGRSLNLFGYLLLHRQTQLRERVASALWPDHLDTQARANLRRTLHELVAVLPPATEPWIVADAKSIELNPRASLWCDVDAFDRLSEREETRADAIDLYRGDLLAGEEADWVLDARARFRERQIDAVATLAEACFVASDRAGATRHYRTLLALDPYREDALRALLILRYARGDRAGAISEYRGFVHRLESDLGVEPMPETVACYENLLRDRLDDLRAERFRRAEPTTFARIPSSVLVAEVR